MQPNIALCEIMRILFVDDLPDTRDVFRLAFGIQGHSTRLAANGREAVEAATEEKFDAIIMDVEMPEMNGFDAVKAIRHLEGGGDVPIIMFTAYGDNEASVKSNEAGADLLLHKPILPQELLAKIEQLSH